MRTSVVIQRDILYYHSKGGHSNRTIAQHLQINHKTVGTVRQKFKACGLSYEQIIALDDTAFTRRLGTQLKVGKSNCIIPDYSKIQDELQLRDMTLTLLWYEYRAGINEQNKDQYLSYSQFCRQYKDWLKSQRISMRQFHKPGEKMFVDFCGRTMPITDFETGEVTYAHVFVAVLGASGYTFALAVPSQKIKDWILCNINALEFFGGVPQQVVPDNLKSAVIKHTPNEIILNRAYADMADHYDLIINPARSRKPKDKSLAEVTVQIVQRFALAPLRHRKFFTVHELNQELTHRINFLNNKTSTKYKQSRYERFLDLERDALQPLPVDSYDVAEWRYSVRVPTDYHIVHENHYYSVPYQHRQQLVDIRVTNNVIEVLLGRNRIASHALSNSIGKTTIQEHMPLDHLKYAEADPDELLLWAKDIGQSVYDWVYKNLKQRQNYASGLKSVSRLRTWAREEQNHNRLESACAFALSIGEFSFQRMQSIIRSNSDLRQKVENTSWVTDHEHIRGSSYYASSGDSTC
ncbi:MAG: IS21 family transposase [Gammaproteobacteria bacterium]